MEPLAVRVEARPDAFHSFPAPQSHLFKEEVAPRGGVPFCETGAIAETRALRKR